MTIDEAMEQVRHPDVLDDDRKLNLVLHSVFEEGRIQGVEEGRRENGADHGVIMFKDGTTEAI